MLNFVLTVISLLLSVHLIVVLAQYDLTATAVTHLVVHDVVVVDSVLWLHGLANL